MSALEYLRDVLAWWKDERLEVKAGYICFYCLFFGLALALIATLTHDWHVSPLAPYSL